MCNQKGNTNNPTQEDPKIKFMLAEYQGMTNSLSDLYPVLMKMMNYFFMVAAVPISYVVYLSQTPGTDFDLGNMHIPLIIIFAVISFSGLLFSLILVNVRMGMRKYARAISLIRKFFIEYDESVKIIYPYVYMPASDKEPEYFKKWGFLFWQVLLIGLVDGLYLTLFLKNVGICSWEICIFVGLVYLLSHSIAYYIMANYREHEDEKRFEKHLTSYNDNLYNKTHKHRRNRQR